jgi:uncharacterized phage protein (TIGR01671 family)
MREIKFRHFQGKFMSNNLQPLDIRDENFRTVLINSNGHGIWMQYAGLKDKNGKEIYEGDIISMTEYGMHKNFTVEFKDGAFYPLVLEQWGCCNGFYNNDTEVIGNCYENPELLK